LVAAAPSAAQSARRFSRCNALASLAAAMVPRPKIRVTQLCGGRVALQTLRAQAPDSSAASTPLTPQRRSGNVGEDAHPTTPTTQHGAATAGEGMPCASLLPFEFQKRNENNNARPGERQAGREEVVQVADTSTCPPSTRPSNGHGRGENSRGPNGPWLPTAVAHAAVRGHCAKVSGS
jgi:hypothetical protein